MKKQLTFIIFFVFFAGYSIAQSSGFQVFNTNTTITFTGNNFKTIAIAKDGDIWAGTQYQGLYKYNHLIYTWEKCPDLTNVLINDIKADKQGGIWVGQSGITGQSGGGSNIAGGINYFPGPFFAPNNFYTFATGGGLTTRNVRSVWIDSTRVNVQANLPRVWAAQASFITSGNATAGGISGGLNSTIDYFTKVTNGLQVFPYVSTFAAGKPSADAIAGNKEEVWVAVRTNFGRSQILRYHPLNIKGTFLGAYDNTNTPALSASFRANALYFDSEGRQWIGLNSGGLIVKTGVVWKTVNMPDILPPGTAVNSNAIAGDDEGNIYIGTSNGLLVYEGGALDVSTSYTKYTMTDGLPSNNITGIAVDNVNSRILLATDNGVVFWKKNRIINVKLVWDNSFPVVGQKPKGVVADGVSRLYIKVKRGNDTIPVFKKVEVIINDYTNNAATLRGRVKKADTLNVDSYSNEANSGTLIETSRTDSTQKGDYWFWYVSPEDFCLNELSNNANAPERKDTVKVRVTYNNDTKDSVNLLVRIVRPPMVMVHGLASSPAAWDVVKYNATTPLLQSDLFKHKHALQQDGRGSFIQNVILLLGGDIGVGEGVNRLNTLQGNIEEIRKMGFAANQVDFVCHSMGGSVGRSMLRWRSDKYYADGNYKYNNYGKGFMHKMILVNSPNHGSPIPDATQEFLPQAPAPVNFILENWYNTRFNDQMPWDFLAPDYQGGTVKFGTTPAVKNLQVSPSKGGVRQQATDVKYHMIVGDVDWISSSTASALASADQFVELFNNVLTIARDILPPPAKNILTGFLALGKTARAFTFLEWYSQSKNFPNFLGDGDLIVPLGSQTARQSINELHITKFNNSPGEIMDAWHSGILSRVDVGKRIMDLINTKRSSSFFANQIPPNLDPDPTPRPSGALLSTAVVYDTSKIVIRLPARNSNTNSDSIISVRLRLKDTAGLAYIRINFQGTDTFNFGKNAEQQFTLKAGKFFTGRQTLWAMAIYDKPDGTKYFIDTIGLHVSNLATLQGFRVNTKQAEITAGIPYSPSLSVQYSNQWMQLANNNSEISVSFDVPGIITYDVATASFNAVKEGFAQAIILYKGFADTIGLTGALPLFSNCINKTITSGNFKNPAIWSKGLIPYNCDSVVIQQGHTITADTSVKIFSLRINTGGILNLNNSLVKIQLGEKDQATNLIDNYGTLNISNGSFVINGRLKLNAGSTFNMTGGSVILNSNTGDAFTSLPNGNSIFEAAASMATFNFSGGTVQITDPPLGAASQSINCPYDFGVNSTVVLGNGSSTTASKNTDGFGGHLFPNKIGRLIINATTKNGNRQFINKKALNVKGNLEVRNGSSLILQAPITVNQ